MKHDAQMAPRIRANRDPREPNYYPDSEWAGLLAEHRRQAMKPVERFAIWRTALLVVAVLAVVAVIIARM